MSRVENSSLVRDKAAPLRYQESASPKHRKHILDSSENNAKQPVSKSQALENVRKSGFDEYQYQEHVAAVIPIIRTPTAGRERISNFPMSSPGSKGGPLYSGTSEASTRNRSSSALSPPANKKKRIHSIIKKITSSSTETAASRTTQATRTTENVTSEETLRQKRKSLAGEPQADEVTESDSKHEREDLVLVLWLMDYLARNAEDAIIILKWLSGNYEPSDLDKEDPEDPESVSMTLQRLKFHHIEVLEGLKAADWQLIRESGEVAYNLFRGELASETEAVIHDGDEKQRFYRGKSRNTRLIYGF
ncbi:hypothetical protein TWF506_011337 [Arthrobotrys conoides]|uniref:Uncharacterized protein n=1 Tax=Arthrobotrys conoides TaxID=74498 RepID=A0AAN8NJM8_9PEZI